MGRIPRKSTVDEEGIFQGEPPDVWSTPCLDACAGLDSTPAIVAVDDDLLRSQSYRFFPNRSEHRNKIDTPTMPRAKVKASLRIECRENLTSL
jgi:hypothetical protein